MPGSKVPVAISVLLLLLGAAAALTRWIPATITKQVDVSHVRPWQGRAFIFPVSGYLPGRWAEWLLDLPADTNESPADSPVQLIEDRVPLATAHSLHVDIVEKGGGRYSHWAGDVIFAPSDNSAPASNGRSYAVRYPIIAAPWVAAVLIALGATGLATRGMSWLRARPRDETAAPAVLRRVGLWASSVAVAAGVAGAVSCFSSSLSIPLDAKSARQREGNSYTLPISDLLPRGVTAFLLALESESIEPSTVSRLRVLEDGVRIGVPHSLHGDIAQKGGGRFSHWGPHLIFSASDNSNPATNGRTYAVSIPLASAGWLPLALLVAGLAGMLALRDPTRAAARWIEGKPALFFWLGAAALAVHFNFVFASLVTAPLPYPDSQGYLSWWLFRTPGYPLFLSAYHAILESWRYLPLVQLNLVLGSLVLLAFAVARCTGSYLAGWTCLALAAAGGEILVSSADVLTEAVFAAFATAHVALFMLFLAERRLAFAILSGISLAAAILVKSVAVVLLGPLLVFIAFLPGVRTAIALLVFVPAALGWLLPSACNLARHGFFESSVAGGYALAGHVAWAIHPTPGAPLEAEARAIEKRLRPILARRPARWASRDEYVRYTTNEHIPLWGNLLSEMSGFYGAARCSSAACTWSACKDSCSVLMNRDLLQLSKQAIAGSPYRFAYHVGAHDVGLWRDTFAARTGVLHGAMYRASSLPSVYDPARTPSLAVPGRLPSFKSPDEIAAVVARIEELPLSRMVDAMTLRDFFGNVVLGIPNKFPLPMFGVGMLGCLVVFRLARAGVEARAFCYLALFLNAYFLGTALAQPTLVRYAITMQGIMAAMIVLGVVLLLLTFAGVPRRQDRNS